VPRRLLGISRHGRAQRPRRKNVRGAKASGCPKTSAAQKPPLPGGICPLHALLSRDLTSSYIHVMLLHYTSFELNTVLQDISSKLNTVLQDIECG